MGEFNYTVVAGDTLWSLSQRFGTTVQEIMNLNGLTSSNLSIGQILRIPRTAPCFNYTVVAGDTLWLLAQRFGTTVEAIMAQNGLSNSNLSIGQVLCIPTNNGGTTPPPPPPCFNYTVVAGDTLWALAQRFGTTVDAIISQNGLTSTNLSIGQILCIPNNNGGGNGGGNGKCSAPSFRKTIVVDAGHGGSDSGAVGSGNRLEKNDNLKLALAVRNQLEALGQNVVMTRSSDISVSLPQRSTISNNAKADLFVSLHRDSSTNPNVYGTSNYIYTSAPNSTAQYAFNTLDDIVDVGVQRNIGVIRANYAVLRETAAPAMLLEMGFITNAEDNRLFDQNLENYAIAIACGIIRTFESPRPTYATHTVTSGETLSSIATRYGTTPNALMTLNKLSSTTLIVGQVLRVS